MFILSFNAIVRDDLDGNGFLVDIAIIISAFYVCVIVQIDDPEFLFSFVNSKDSRFVMQRHNLLKLWFTF